MSTLRFVFTFIVDKKLFIISAVPLLACVALHI